MKKFLLSLFCLLLLLPLPAFAQNPIHLCINDFYVENDVDPIMENNRVLVPIRIVSEYLGAEVEWDQKSQMVWIHSYGSNEKTLELTINKKTVKVYSERGTRIYTMDVKPKIVENRTLVPIRFVSELMDKPVTWDQANQTVAVGDSYHAIQRKGHLKVQWKGRSFPVKFLQIANRPFVSLRDFSEKMNWPYTIDRYTYDYGGGGIGLILTDPILDKKIIFHSRGTECDGVAISASDNYDANQVYYNKEFYIPLDELILGFHWNASYNEDKTQVSLIEKEDGVTYRLFYDLLDPSSSPEEYKYMHVPSTLYTIVYKNNHFTLVPMNRTIEDYTNELYTKIEQGLYSYREDDAHLYGCSVFVLDEENKTITGFQAN
ncbi:MAG: copper amine oxidase N-terminal domain-containing protein [Peptoniphilus sp.]|nr:copper amine oxidase N-terminal domain-containing protein [Peptoniphilus sp.]MDD7362818.1 copper amine oxidase N-terminal domain-containing protein [Bacillota bacterium]MDY6043990.1 copper amine oxidase N-terminal domain-containing protein [Peptoniphilus sp.]